MDRQQEAERFGSAAGLQAVPALRRLAERLEAGGVAAARRDGWSWQEIGDALGVTRQSVHAKHRQGGEAPIGARHEGHRAGAAYSLGATYLDAAEEALRLGDRKVGAEHLLLALLHVPECRRSLGCDLDAARAALEALDREALQAVGVDVRPGAGEGAPPAHAERLPVTPGAKQALASLRRRARGERLGPEHLLAALRAVGAKDPVAALLDRLDAGRSAAERANGREDEQR